MSAGKTSMPQEFKQLADMGRKMIGQTGPARKEVLRQLTEALKTGGVKAKIPLIQQAVSQSNQATSTALSQTAEQLAQHNVGGPFASRIMAQQRLAGDQATAAIPTGMAERLIGQFTPFLQGTQSLGMGSLSQAGQASFAADAFNAQQFKALMQDIKSSLQGAGAAACLHPESRIETPEGSVRVADLNPGDMVWSESKGGARIPAKVVATAQRYVGLVHQMLEIHAPGGVFFVTPTHPLPSGSLIGNVHGGMLVMNDREFTCDIAVDGPTGVYFVNGFALGSTLDARHNRALAA